jgi:hypothetical protein
MLRVKSTARVILAEDLYGALFVLEGSVEVAAPVSARPRIVRARDTLLLSSGPRRTLTLRCRGRSAAQLIFLCWRPGRNGP